MGQHLGNARFGELCCATLRDSKRHTQQNAPRGDNNGLTAAPTMWCLPRSHGSWFWQGIRHRGCIVASGERSLRISQQARAEWIGRCGAWLRHGRGWDLCSGSGCRQRRSERHVVQLTQLRRGQRSSKSSAFCPNADQLQDIFMGNATNHATAHERQRARPRHWVRCHV